MIKALLFDFNGVIIDDEPIQMEAYREILKEEGIELTKEDYESCFGMNDRVFVQTNYKRAEKEISEEKLTQIVDAKTANWRKRVETEIPIFEGVRDFIKRMENDFTLGIVTMARRPEVDFILEQTGLANSFSIIVSSEDISTVKPDPECYREGFRLVDNARTSLGKNPMTRNQCVIIEDTPQGIIAGRKARLKTLGVTNSVNAEELRKAGADSVTHSLKDWFPDSFRGVFS